MPTPACPHITRAAKLWLMNPDWMGRKAGAMALERSSFPGLEGLSPKQRKNKLKSLRQMKSRMEARISKEDKERMEAEKQERSNTAQKSSIEQVENLPNITRTIPILGNNSNGNNSVKNANDLHLSKHDPKGLRLNPSQLLKTTSNRLKHDRKRHLAYTEAIETYAKERKKVCGGFSAAKVSEAVGNKHCVAISHKTVLNKFKKAEKNPIKTEHDFSVGRKERDTLVDMLVKLEDKDFDEMVKRVRELKRVKAEQVKVGVR